jgi:hypothetical protein
MLLFFACVLPEPDQDGGQSGNEGHHDDDGLLEGPHCEETSREEVALDATAAGLTDTPQEILDTTTGTWTGWFDHDFTDAGELTDGAMEIVYEGAPVEAVTQVQVRYTGDEDDVDTIREPSPDCPDHYEIPARATLYGDEGYLDEAFALTLIGNGETESTFAAAIPLDSVGGTARPSWDTSAWETTELQLDGSAIDDGGTAYLIVSAAWLSLRYPSEHSVEQQDEDIGGFALER